MKQWYYAENDQKKGPLDEPDFMELIRTGNLSAETLVWSEGMGDWAKIGSIQIYGEPRAEVAVAATSSISEVNNHRGIGRGAYFGLLIFCGFIQSLTSKTPELLWLALAIALFIGGQRFRNIGYNAWWILLGLIPIVNLVIAYRCLACPAGYAQTKQPDLIMKRVNWIYAIAVIGIILAILIPTIAGR